jgi:heme oxygenase
MMHVHIRYYGSFSQGQINHNLGNLKKSPDREFDNFFLFDILCSHIMSVRQLR